VIEMNRKVLLIVLTLAVVLLATPYIGMAHAKPSTTVSGTIAVLSGFPTIKPVGGANNEIWIMDLAEEWFGDIAGVGVTPESIWVWHHSFPPMIGPDYTINIHEKLTFHDAMVLGESGDLFMEVILKADITGGSGHWTILGGTEGLANLHGQGTLSLSTTPYSYTGQVHFDP
jgi:hypothetical protein